MVSQIDRTMLPDGTLIYLEFSEFQGEELEFGIGCACGGESPDFTIKCLAASDPNSVTVAESACGKCGRTLKILVYFYKPESVERGKISRFNFNVWIGLDLPVVIGCSCGGVSSSILVRCLPGQSHIASSCQNCQAKLEAIISFELS